MKLRDWMVSLSITCGVVTCLLSYACLGIHVDNKEVAFLFGNVCGWGFIILGTIHASRQAILDKLNDIHRELQDKGD